MSSELQNGQIKFSESFSSGTLSIFLILYINVPIFTNCLTHVSNMVKYDEQSRGLFYDGVNLSHQLLV